MPDEAPQYYHVPVKPSRQPSRMARGANGRVLERPGGSSAEQGGFAPPSYPLDSRSRAPSSPFPSSPSPLDAHRQSAFFPNPHEQSGSTAIDSAASFGNEQRLRHRTGESISRQHPRPAYLEPQRGLAGESFEIVRPSPSPRSHSNTTGSDRQGNTHYSDYGYVERGPHFRGADDSSLYGSPSRPQFALSHQDSYDNMLRSKMNDRGQTVRSSFGNNANEAEFDAPPHAAYNNITRYESDPGSVTLTHGQEYAMGQLSQSNTYSHSHSQEDYKTIYIGNQGDGYESTTRVDTYGLAPELPYSNMRMKNGFGSEHGYDQQSKEASYVNFHDGAPQMQPNYGAPFVGGFVGIAAPGTYITRPQMQPSTAYNDPSAFDNARQRLLRRRTVRKIPLTNGNLVIDVPVPSTICKGEQGEEFRIARYTAATCDPDDWIAERYALRQFLMGRKIELAICMTCYNEDEELLYRTLGSVIRNIGYLQSRTRSGTWGEGSWSKVVVVIVGDGRKKANERMLKMLACYGIFAEGAMKDHVMSRPTSAHVFELTTQVIVDPKGGVQVAPCPIQLVFCLKEQNQKKINSHRWFFNAFCTQLQPNVTVLLDVGTKPTGHSIYHLWKAFDKQEKVAGACGEIAVDTGKLGWRLYNPLVAAQNFEYKISNILDKPLESVVGFIGVLPGAFSAYRWKALKGRPLEAYFKGEQIHNGTIEHPGTFKSNMFLAEDRILCFELVTKKNEAWILKYVKAAKATTDVPDGVAELIGQRRRWLNGSLFAGMFALMHFGRIWTSGQSFGRKIMLQLQVIYNLVQLIFTASALANCYLATYFLMKSATSNSAHDPFVGYGSAVFDLVLNLYIGLIVVVTVASLGSRPAGFRALYILCILLFSALFILLLYCVGWTVYLQLDAAHLLQTSGWSTRHLFKILTSSENIRSIVLSILATYGLYLVASLAYLEPWHMLTSFLQALVLSPFFITVLSIYSMANLHDVSWGTKGSDAAASDLGGATGSADKKDGSDALVTVKVPTSTADANELWTHAQTDLSNKPVEKKQHRSKSAKLSDEQQNFRTKMLLLWLGFNALLVIIFTSKFWDDYTNNDLHLTLNPYLAALFYSTAALSAVRALGAFTYLALRLFGR